MSLIPLATLVLTVLLFIFPYARPLPNYVAIEKTRTVIGLFAESMLGMTRRPVPSLIVLLTVLANLLPALIVWQAIDVAPKSPGLGGWLIIESILCLAGGAVMFVIIAFTYVTFGFSASRSGKTTIVGLALTVVSLLGAIIGIITAIAPAWLAKLGR